MDSVSLEVISRARARSETAASAFTERQPAHVSECGGSTYGFKGVAALRRERLNEPETMPYRPTRALEWASRGTES